MNCVPLRVLRQIQSCFLCGAGGGGGGGGGYMGYFGTGVRASISKPNPFIYLAFEKTDPFIYLIIQNVDLFIYCPLIFCTHFCWLLDKYQSNISQFIEYQENKQLRKISERNILCAYTRMSEKRGLSHRNPEKSGHSYTFCWRKGDQSCTWQGWKRGVFGTHIRTMP